jgi:hypothetical protein
MFPVAKPRVPIYPIQHQTCKKTVIHACFQAQELNVPPPVNLARNSYAFMRHAQCCVAASNDHTRLGSHRPPSTSASGCRRGGLASPHVRNPGHRSPQPKQTLQFSWTLWRGQSWLEPLTIPSSGSRPWG